MENKQKEEVCNDKHRQSHNQQQLLSSQAYCYISKLYIYIIGVSQPRGSQYFDNNFTAWDESPISPDTLSYVHIIQIIQIHTSICNMHSFLWLLSMDGENNEQFPRQFIHYGHKLWQCLHHFMEDEEMKYLLNAGIKSWRLGVVWWYVT